MGAHRRERWEAAGFVGEEQRAARRPVAQQRGELHRPSEFGQRGAAALFGRLDDMRTHPVEIQFVDDGPLSDDRQEPRDAKLHGFPIRISELIAQLDGAAYVARGATNTVGLVWKTRAMLKRAFELQSQNAGFTFVEILTMCPTGWFIETGDAPDYLAQNLESYHRVGVIKDIGLETAAS